MEGGGILWKYWGKSL